MIAMRDQSACSKVRKKKSRSLHWLTLALLTRKSSSQHMSEAHHCRIGPRRAYNYSIHIGLLSICQDCRPRMLLACICSLIDSNERDFRENEHSPVQELMSKHK